MIQLLFSVLAAEATLVFLLLIKTPLRNLIVMGLDHLKRGRGPVMVRTVAGTVFLVLFSSVYSMEKIQSRSSEVGALTPTDQVLWSRHLLEASLMGFSLFLLLIIDRMHHYVREIRGLKKSVEAANKENRMLEDGNLDEIKSRDKKIATLKERVKKLESEFKTRAEEAKAGEATVRALKTQSEGSHIEYERLLEDNRNLQEQLQSIEGDLQHSDVKNL